MSWQEEAKGIEPWPGALLVSGERCCVVGKGGWVVVATDSSPYGSTAILDAGSPNMPPVDLSDPDTRAAFDRRLALRLGAPVEAMTEGVVFYENCGGIDQWTVHVGANERWRVVMNFDGTAGKPLLARVRAWKSVAG